MVQLLLFHLLYKFSFHSMRRLILLFVILSSTLQLMAHPLPSSVVKLSVLEHAIKGEAIMPLGELANAIKQDNITNINTPFFKDYFLNHIRAISGSKQWQTQLQAVTVEDGQDSTIGKYKEVVVHFVMTPQSDAELRNFTFDYSVIVHQVVTHKILVYIEQDWNNGIQTEEDTRGVGIIKMNLSTEKVDPLEVNLEHGSLWKGFNSMLKLGMQHIKEGTDHLLFVIVLLLPAMLMTANRRWGSFGGLKYSVTHLIKIVTAFTVGHSITLLLGATGLLRLPGQPVEVLIAFSILVSAVHAVRPVFPGKEVFVAAAFGLIHGSAFASVLAGLDLGFRSMTLSILGFNLGIEVMQLFIIALIVPWLMLLSRTGVYKHFRIAGAIGAGIAATAWIVERISGQVNAITVMVESMAAHGVWLLITLAVFSVTISIAHKRFFKLPVRLITTER